MFGNTKKIQVSWDPAIPQSADIWLTPVKSLGAHCVGAVYCYRLTPQSPQKTKARFALVDSVQIVCVPLGDLAMRSSRQVGPRCGRLPWNVCGSRRGALFLLCFIFRHNAKKHLGSERELFGSLLPRTSQARCAQVRTRYVCSLPLVCGEKKNERRKGILFPWSYVTVRAPLFSWGQR